jgi:hypothetical protein
MHGSVGSLPSREDGSEAARRMVVPEPSCLGRYGLIPLDMRQSMVTHALLLALGWSLHAGVPSLLGVDN